MSYLRSGRLSNFSSQQIKIYDLADDLFRCNYTEIKDSGVDKKDLENYLRDKINNDILKGKTLFQAFRRNSIEMYEIMEEIVNITIGEDVFHSSFVEAFVEWKNRALGDKSEFYYEGGLLSVASFAGNHWDTNRQSLDLGESFTLPAEWIYIHVYEELERFLLNFCDSSRILDKIYKSINKYFKDRISMQFQNVSSCIPLDFVRNINSEESLGELCDIVQSAGGYDSLTIAATKGGLRKLANIVPDKMFANSQKEAKVQTGSIGEWEGNNLMVIPQVLRSGTYNLALSDKQLFIMGGDVKPIKCEFFGDTRSFNNTNSTNDTKNNDMTQEIQLQTKLGMGMILPPYFGMANFV